MSYELTGGKDAIINGFANLSVPKVQFNRQFVDC